VDARLGPDLVSALLPADPGPLPLARRADACHSGASTGIFVNPSPGRRIDDDINTGGAPVNWIFRAFLPAFCCD